jgi:hypothetical protein
MPRTKRSRRTVARTAAISVRVEPELKQAVDKLAEEDHRTLAQYVERLLIEHVQAKGLQAKPPAKPSRKR